MCNSWLLLGGLYFSYTREMYVYKPNLSVYLLHLSVVHFILLKKKYIYTYMYTKNFQVCFLTLRAVIPLKVNK